MTHIIVGTLLITIIVGFLIGVYFTRLWDKQFLVQDENSECANTPKVEEDTVLKDRISTLEKRVHGLNMKMRLEEEGIKEGSIILKAYYPSSIGIRASVGNFVVTECSHEMLEDNRITVEDVHHNSQEIEAFGISLADKIDKNKFIQEYNDYADKLKIEIPSEDD